MIDITLGAEESVLVISDLHLGDGSKSDDFAYRNYSKVKTDLPAFINKYNPTHLILAGDVEELWQHHKSDVKNEYKELLSYFDSKNTIRLRGNHDLLKKYDESCKVTLPSGKTMFIAHGHQNDRYMKNIFVKMGVFFVGLIEKLFPNVEALYNTFSNKDVSKTVIYKNTLKYANECLKKHDYVILGHTHDLRQMVNYYNCGTCQHGSTEGIFVQGDTIKLVNS